MFDFKTIVIHVQAAQSSMIVQLVNNAKMCDLPRFVQDLFSAGIIFVRSNLLWLEYPRINSNEESAQMIPSSYWVVADKSQERGFYCMPMKRFVFASKL